MASKPPSRRKPGENTLEPKTIDLQADPVASPAETPDTIVVPGEDMHAEAVTSEPTPVDPVPADTIPAEPAIDAAPASDAGAETSSPSTASSSPWPRDTAAPAEEETPPAEPARETAADVSAAFSEEPKSAAQPETAHYTVEAPRNSGTSTSGALAAGILGGLVVLAAAGSLQYAGILPSLSPRESGSEAIAALQTEIDLLKNAQPSAPVDLAPLEQRLAAIEARTEQPQAQVDLAPLSQQVADLGAAVASLQSGIGTADTARTDMTARLDAIEKKLAEPTAETRLARAVAVTALKTAIDRGGPFLAELDAFRSVSPDDPAVAPLSEDAQTGVLTRSDLIDGFPAVADTMLDAIRQRDPNQGVFGRLLDSAASAVRIRPVGDVAGEGPDAVVARIERSLTNGDLKAAALEWNTLPEAAKAAGADFRSKLDRRIAVETAIDAAVSAPVTGTSNQG